MFQLIYSLNGKIDISNHSSKEEARKAMIEGVKEYLEIDEHLQVYEKNKSLDGNCKLITDREWDLTIEVKDDEAYVHIVEEQEEACWKIQEI